MAFRCMLALLLALTSASSALAQAPAGLAASLSDLEASLPQSADDFSAQSVERLRAAAQQLEEAMVRTARFPQVETMNDVLSTADQMMIVKLRADGLMDKAMAMRTQFADLEEGPSRREWIRHYLQSTSTLIDLSGRLRYLLYDALGTAAYSVATSDPHREALLDRMILRRSSIGAVVMSVLLFDPPATAPKEVQPASAVVRAKTLKLIAVARNFDLLGTVTRFLTSGPATPTLTVLAAETIREVGLPQDARAGQPDDVAEPAITARQLHEIVAKVDVNQLPLELRERRQELLDWLVDRAQHGITGDSYRFGESDLHAGDWLLMRNPSPYNLFTDLSPGLFTHVGVATFETGEDGIRRLVLVDLPERGQKMPASTVDGFLARTLHYVWLRHPDATVASKMAEAARQVIGNDITFDLNFRTERVKQVDQTSLRGTHINTYCAGFLLLCSMHSNAPRSDFFPIQEYPAGKTTLENLRRFGMSIGDDFISPTGALFSQRLQLVGSRSAMYDPSREIEEAIFDYFAEELELETITPPSDLVQSIRLQLAQAAKAQPWLAKALANANNVSEDLDLVAAARAAAVVESLDSAAFGASRRYREARRAILAGPIDQSAQSGLSKEQIAHLRAWQQQHPDLVRAWQARQLTPRDLRIRLVEHYIRQGKEEIDRRFFGK